MDTEDGFPISIFYISFCQYQLKKTISFVDRKCRSSRRKVFCKKGVLRNFAKFTGNHHAINFVNEHGKKTLWKQSPIIYNNLQKTISFVDRKCRSSCREVFCKKRYSQKFRKIHRKTPCHELHKWTWRTVFLWPYSVSASVNINWAKKILAAHRYF